MLRKLTAPLRHNFGLCIGLAVCAAALAWAYGCESTTKSPSDPKLRVTRAELDAEVENLAAKISLAYADITKQDEVKQKILNIGIAYASGEGFSPIGLVSTLAGLAGLGAVIDNRRKDAVIKSKQGVTVKTPKKIRRRKP